MSKAQCAPQNTSSTSPSTFKAKNSPSERQANGMHEYAPDKPAATQPAHGYCEAKQRGDPARRRGAAGRRCNAQRGEVRGGTAFSHGRGRADLAASLQGAHTDRPAADSNPALVSSEKKETRQEYQTRWLVPSYRTQQQEAEMSDPGLTDQIGTPDSDLP